MNTEQESPMNGVRHVLLAVKLAAVGLLFFWLGAMGVGAQVLNDPDLPGAGATYETVPAGSLVIAMDPSLQGLVGPFNMKAYGLVNALLHTNIPVKWADRKSVV